MGKKADMTVAGGWSNPIVQHTGYYNDEQKTVLKAYGIDPRNYRTSHKRYHGDDRLYKQLPGDLTRKANNDYDTRRALEAMALQGNEEAKKFAKKGFANADEVQAGYNLLKQAHRDAGNDGEFSSANDFAGVAYGAVGKDRNALIEQLTPKPQPKAEDKEENKGFTDPINRQESPALTAAKERVTAFQTASGFGTQAKDEQVAQATSTDAPKTDIYAEVQSNQVPAARDQAGSMLEQYKAKYKSKMNFQPDL